MGTGEDLSMKICAFVGDIYRDYSSAVIKLLQKRAVDHGHTIDIFGNCAVPSENPLHSEGFKSILLLPKLDTYDGIILCSDTLNHAGMRKRLLDNLRSAEHLPPVISLRSAEEGFCNILPDNRQLMYEVARYVISLCGTDDIGFVTGRDDLEDSFERRAGFEKAMHEAGYGINEDLIFHGNYWVDQGKQTADFFIRKDGSLPKAIICSNDYMAWGLIDELILRGYKIPEDVMITGIDNQPTSDTRIPSLTTSEISETALVDTAMNSLEQAVRGGMKDETVLVPGYLIIRESTGGKTDRDVNEAYSLLDTMQKVYYDKALAFLRLNSDYGEALSYSEAIDITLRYLTDLSLFRRVFLVRRLENDLELIGSADESDISIRHDTFPASDLLPDTLDADRSAVRIFLPVFYKNEVYGYCVLELDPATDRFFDEKLEFALMMFGQTLNKLELYQKLGEANNVMELYVKDALTGVYNRRGFENNISPLLKDNDGSKKIAVASIDMDGLKGINDTFGHSAGDTAIKAMADCISSALREGEFAARMGGDEFEAVLILDDSGRIGHFIRSLRKAIDDANVRIGTAYTLSASIGISEVPDWNSLMDSMDKADEAMYIEKKIKKKRDH